MHRQATYNYPAFSWELETEELKRWLLEGPRTGDVAPDFELPDLDGTTVRLRELRGRPIAIEFGSYSCPIFSDRVPEMERLAREHDETDFLVIVVREAHPGELQRRHATLAEKNIAARKLVLEEGLRRRVLIDDLQGTVHRAYGGGWNPVYVLDKEGKVVFRRAWNLPGDVDATLNALRDASSPPAGETVEMAPLPGRQAIGLRLLERGGREALLDFYRGAPDPVRRRLEQSASAFVRSALKEATK